VLAGGLGASLMFELLKRADSCREAGLRAA
jgi:hypothetical protein